MVKKFLLLCTMPLALQGMMRNPLQMMPNKGAIPGISNDVFSVLFYNREASSSTQQTTNNDSSEKARSLMEMSKAIAYPVALTAYNGSKFALSKGAQGLYASGKFGLSAFINNPVQTGTIVVGVGGIVVGGAVGLYALWKLTKIRQQTKEDMRADFHYADEKATDVSEEALSEVAKNLSELTSRVNKGVARLDVPLDTTIKSASDLLRVLSQLGSNIDNQERSCGAILASMDALEAEYTGMRSANGDIFNQAALARLKPYVELAKAGQLNGKHLDEYTALVAEMIKLS